MVSRTVVALSTSLENVMIAGAHFHMHFLFRAPAIVRVQIKIRPVAFLHRFGNNFGIFLFLKKHFAQIVQEAVDDLDQ